MAYNVRIMPVKVCVGYWELMIANAQAGQTGFLPEDSGGLSVRRDYRRASATRPTTAPR